MQASIVVRVAGALALALVLAPTVVADNALGLTDSPQARATKPAAKKSSWLPFNLFQSTAKAETSASAKPAPLPKAKGPSMMDRVSASFAKMNADTKRAMTRTATTLGLKKKPATTSSPYGTWGSSKSHRSTKSKSKKKSSGFGSLFVKPAPRPSSTVDDFFKQPRPGEDSGF